MKHLNYFLPITCLLLGGCFTIKTVNISQKTSLEHQLMGSFEPLTEEEMLLGTVRDEAQLLQATEQSLDQLALQARRRQLFNRDDINTFKETGQEQNKTRPRSIWLWQCGGEKEGNMS